LSQEKRRNWLEIARKSSIEKNSIQVYAIESKKEKIKEKK